MGFVWGKEGRRRVKGRSGFCRERVRILGLEGGRRVSKMK